MGQHALYGIRLYDLLILLLLIAVMFDSERRFFLGFVFFQLDVCMRDTMVSPHKMG